jgi:UDP-galactopyranose mutase
MEGWLLSRIGRELYETFYKGYTTKQWGRDPADLPAFIASRVPIRLTFDDGYYADRYHGIPVGGYTKMVETILHRVEVKLDTDFFSNRPHLEGCAKKPVYTGPIDRFFDYKHGSLEYRSLRFESEIVSGIEAESKLLRVHAKLLCRDRSLVSSQYPPLNKREYEVNPRRNGMDLFFSVSPTQPIRDFIKQRRYQSETIRIIRLTAYKHIG